MTTGGDGVGDGAPYSFVFRADLTLRIIGVEFSCFHLKCELEGISPVCVDREVRNL
jgi:hypothetical protein